MLCHAVLCMNLVFGTNSLRLENCAISCAIVSWIVREQEHAFY